MIRVISNSNVEVLIQFAAVFFGEFNTILGSVVHATCAKRVFIAHGILFTLTAPRLIIFVLSNKHTLFTLVVYITKVD